jgi:hypothetical protein
MRFYRPYVFYIRLIFEGDFGICVWFNVTAVRGFKFHIQTYSFDNSLSVDRFFNLQMESWYMLVYV